MTDPAPGWTTRRRTVAGATAATSAISALTFYAGPTSWKTTVWMTGTGLMLALMFVGIALFRTRSLRPWLFVVGGLASAYLAMFLMNYGRWFGLEFSAPSVLDGLMLANYPMAAIGAFLMLSRLHVRTGYHAMLETVTLTVAGGLLIWVFVGVRAVESSEAAFINKLVAGAYPMGNVLLLAILAAVAVRLKDRPGPMILLSLGFAGNLAADLISSYQRLEGTYQPGGWIDFGWLLCFAGLSIAPSWPDSAASFSESLDTDRGQVTAGRLVVLLSALFSVPAVLIVQQLDGTGAADLVATIGAMVVFALVLARVALYNQDLRTREAELKAAHTELTKAHDELGRADHDKQMLLWRINRAVEEERSRIAAEIHDRPVQELTAVGYQIEMAAMALLSNDVDRAAELCDDVADGLSGQLTALRQLMVEIRPPVLDERGLFGALTDAGAAFERHHDGVSVTVTGSAPDLRDEAETVLYRVAQEALTNVAKHAEASLVSIELTPSPSGAELRIVDDGVGFDTSQTDKFVGLGHFGLAGMAERVAMLGGSVDLLSSVGSGTALTFVVPSHSDSAVETLTTTGASAV